MAGKLDRKFCGVVYPDAENYDCSSVLAKLAATFVSWAYIPHDMDVDEYGELKKPHFHWVGKVDNPTSPSAVAHKLGVPANDVCYCKSWKAQVRYLTHADDLEKYPYEVGLVTANFDVASFTSKDGERVKAGAIFDVIVERNITSVSELTKWCLDNDCWSEYRRAFAIWSAVMNERRILK